MRLDQLREICAAATPGPWHVEQMHPGNEPEDFYWLVRNDRDDYSEQEPWLHAERLFKVDAEYIAAFDPDTMRKILDDYAVMKLALERITNEKHPQFIAGQALARLEAEE